MKYTMTKWLSPYIHSDPVEYEEYLENLAQQGWHPIKVGHFDALMMKFQKADPKKYRYVVDLQPIVRDEYLQLYKDLGWDWVGRMSNIIVWRKEYSGERPESFSDKESLVRRNKRFSTIIGIMFFIFLLCAVISTIGLPILSTLLPDTNKDKIDIIADTASSIAGTILIDVFAIALGFAWRRVHGKKK